MPRSRASDVVSAMGPHTAQGGRIVDIGGQVDPVDDNTYEEDKALVVFAVDPGETTGWSAMKVPVARLVAEGATRTLPWCRWRHGEIRRSVPPGTGDMAQAVSDSQHVSLILEQAAKIYAEFVYEPTEQEQEEEGWESDEFVFVLERFGLRILSMDTNLLAPVRVLDRLLDRMWCEESELPVFFHSSSEAMNTVTDERLRRWHMYDSGSGVHARDADRHALLFVRRFSDSQDLRSRLGFAI